MVIIETKLKKIDIFPIILTWFFCFQVPKVVRNLELNSFSIGNI